MIVRKILVTLSLSLPLIPVTAQLQLQPTSAKERMEGETRRKQLEEKSLISRVTFKNIGPTITSGRVTDLDANPEKPTEFYVSYSSGGLWYTKNNGQSFIPVTDNLPTTFMGAVSVNWKEKIVWIGTGEPNSLRSTYAGTGVYKSRDNGKHWEFLGLPESHHIGKIALHPTNPDIAWVAVMGHLYSPNKERGVYMTSDGGKTWKQTLYIDDKTGAIDVAVDPMNPLNVYATMWYKIRSAWNLEESGKTSGIYKSTDGGKTWKCMNTPASGFPTGDGVGRIGLAVYPKQPNIVYAVVDNNANRPATETPRRTETDTVYTLNDFKNLSKEKFDQLDDKKFNLFLRQNGLVQYKAADIKTKVATGIFKPTVIEDYFGDAGDAIQAITNTPIIGAELYRSDDAGVTWKRTHKDFLEGMFFTYGYVFARVWVSPMNPDKVVLISVPLMESTDGGKTFKSIGKENVHVDHHAFWFDPKDDDHFINGNDGGINISYDNGETWFKANTPAVSQFYSITTDNKKPYNVYGGMQDNGVWFGPSNFTASYDWYGDGQYPYKNIGGGDGMQVQVDLRDNTTFYTGSQFGAYFRGNTESNGNRLSIRPAHQLGEKPLRFNWLTPILLSRHNQDILYYGTNRFHRSLAKGDKMETLSPDLTNGYVPGNVPYGTLTTITESPLRFGLLYTGTDDGNIHISKDDGYTWTNISGKLPQKLWLSRVVASKFATGRVYASLTGYRYDNFAPYLYVSEDYGATWQAIGKELPMEPINVIQEDPDHENILYVGTDNGLYVSFDKGTSFMAATGGLPRVPVYDIAIQERDHEIVLGTHGRSAFTAKIDKLQQLTPALLKQEVAMLDFEPPLLQGANNRRRGRRAAAATIMEVPYFVQSAGTVTFTVLSDKGATIATVADTAVKGLNFLQYDLRIDQAAMASFPENTRYLPAGNYEAVITLPNGKKTSKKFSLRVNTEAVNNNEPLTEEEMEEEF